MGYAQKNQYFHGQLYEELYAFRPTVVALGQRKEFIIQERQVSYRITAHFHPYLEGICRLHKIELASAPTFFNGYERDFSIILLGFGMGCYFIDHFIGLKLAERIVFHTKVPKLNS